METISIDIENNSRGIENGELREVPPIIRSTPFWWQYELITPERAAYLLQFNDHNRNISQKNLRDLEINLKKDSWVPNTQTIGVATSNGKVAMLMDGQTRLTACINTGVAFESNVIYYPLEESGGYNMFKTIDVGKSRSLPDLIQTTHSGPKNIPIGHQRTMVTSYANARALVERTKVQKFIEENLGPINEILGPLVVTNLEKLVFLDDQKNLNLLKFGYDMIYKGQKSNARDCVNTTALGGMMIIYCINPEEALKFFTMVSSGTNLEEGMPAKALRDYLQKNPPHGNQVHSSSALKRLSAVFKSWNAYCKNESMRQIKGVESKEDLPEILFGRSVNPSLLTKFAKNFNFLIKEK
jgi:hypothetical protein